MSQGKATKHAPFMVQLDHLVTDFHVRTQLNQDHVLTLALHYDAGEALDPLQVAKIADQPGYYRIVEGRHRREARSVAGKTDALCTLVEGTEIELIAMAFRANYGGKLPPTQADIEYTIEMLMLKGQTEAMIVPLLAPLPYTVGRKLVHQVRYKLHRRTLSDAMQAVLGSGLTLVQAADKYGVKEEELREVMGDKKDKIVKNSQLGMDAFKGQITNRYRGVGIRNSRTLKKVLDGYRDGVVTEQVAFGVMAHMFKSVRSHQDSIKAWADRLESERKNKSVKVPKEVLAL